MKADSCVALVLFTEAHVTVAVTLRHTCVVHHEKVDIKVIGARSLHLVVFCTDELHHFDTAAFAFLHFRHVIFVNRVIERIVASRIVPGVTIEAINFFIRHTVSASCADGTGKIHEKKKCSQGGKMSGVCHSRLA